MKRLGFLHVFAKLSFCCCCCCCLPAHLFLARIDSMKPLRHQRLDTQSRPSESRGRETLGLLSHILRWLDPSDTLPNGGWSPRIPGLLLTMGLDPPGKLTISARLTDRGSPRENSLVFLGHEVAPCERTGFGPLGRTETAADLKASETSRGLIEEHMDMAKCH